MSVYGRPEPTSVANQGDAGALWSDRDAADAAGAGGVLPGPVHDLRAGGDGAPLAGGTPAGTRPAVPRDRRANGRVDHDGDAGRALAPARRGRLQGSAQPRGLLRVALPVKGRLREPSFHLLED